MYKKLFLSVVLIVTSVYLFSESNENKQTLKNWKIADFQGTVDSIPVDTIHQNFQHYLFPIDMYSISNSYNGNLISPFQSKVYFDRPQSDGFLFSNAYSPFMHNITNARFYDTKTPFSSIKFLTGGTTYRKSERVGFLFTANANRKLNFGVNVDYVYARGEYKYQAGKQFSGSFFSTYSGDRYSAVAYLGLNSLSNQENGGITDNVYVEKPPYGYDKAENIPTRFGDGIQSTYNQTQLFFNHSYSLGFEKKVPTIKDSLHTVFVPVTRFIHTLQYDNQQKRYYENAVINNFYKNTYFRVTNDTAAVQRLSNRLAVNLAEEFNKWMRFGLTAFIHNDIERYVFTRDSLLNDSVLYNTKFGGELSKKLGEKLTYKFAGELSFLGYRAGDMKLSADLGTSFRLWKDTIVLKANAFTQSVEPEFHLQNYESNHFIWHNQFKKIFTTHIGGTFAIPTKLLWLDIKIENISNIVYFDSIAKPTQYDGSIQLITAQLKKNFRFGKFGLENTIVYQENINHQDILPLPKVVLYHNIYYIDKWFNVLSAQFGAYMRYHSSYYAPAYMPATGQFYNQQTMKIGNYPVVSLYANMHLKRTRFFFEYTHINQMFMKGLYYSMPYYPINKAMFKMGLTWNFYD